MDKDIKKDSVNINNNDQKSLNETNKYTIPKILIVDDTDFVLDSTSFYNSMDEYDRLYETYRPTYPWEDYMSVNEGIPEEKSKNEINNNEENGYKVSPPRFIQRRKAKLKSVKDMVGIPAAEDFSKIPIGVSRSNYFVYSNGGSVGTGNGYAGMASAGFKPDLSKKYSEKQISYVQNNWTNCVNACSKFGFDPIVELAQGAKESAWGKSSLATNANAFFGIKGSGSANEFWSGEKSGLFRKYSSAQNSFYDHARLISQKSSYKDAYNGGKRNYKEYANKIAYSSYIVDADNRPKYEQDVANIYETCYTIAVQLKLFDPATAQKIAAEQRAKASLNSGAGRGVTVTGASAAEIPDGEPYPKIYRNPMIPPQRPTSTRQQIVKLTNNYSEYPYLVGLRGYYKNESGRPGLNDRGLYDDALFFVLPDKMYAFNFNTDASKYGYNKDPKTKAGYATLKEGTWEYVRGMHNGSVPHLALVQYGKFTVYRDGNSITGKKVEDTGKFGINLHKGSKGGTSSAGCQTVPPSQWDEFYNQLLTKYLPKGKVIKYFLIKV
jgi:lysozyme